ncbi:TRAP-type C4-dicarboxylate transport system substrate-binding protein [Pacificibacter maritimus]|uniref:TRAP-type C4-dicarboxylate transport system substrate-binding protein n=1 Tax=Pacificibacter maritimus TaxID=762213 RepID=A0A3N4UIG3_9RHOB|nr:TRAP transporter substrate-binding protein [Pacificibacter maritimus]RPE67029.1 TRAP-type C4-dicarboxylate transport system substrate-binding protein [Pacificibacter maritimus]
MTTFTRRAALASMGAALATPALMKHAHAAEQTLRVHHFLPPQAPMGKFFETWAAELVEASNGALDVQVFPAMQLGGKPGQLADQARQGVCDIAWTLPAYTAGRYLLAETIGLPFMVTNAEKTSVAFHTIMDEFGTEEYKGLKTLAFHTHDGGKLHTTKAPILSAADLEGTKMRAPNQGTGDLLAALGSEPVFFPVSEMVVGLTNGVIDGCCLPFEVVPAYKLQELTKYSSEAAPGARGIYANPFAIVMNEKTYEGMSDDLRGVIDANSGIELSQRIGKDFDAAEAFGRSVVEKQGNEIHQIPAEEIARWAEAAQPIHDEWVVKLNDAGYDGQAVLNRINELLDAG